MTPLSTEIQLRTSLGCDFSGVVALVKLSGGVDFSAYRNHGRGAALEISWEPGRNGV